MKIKTKDTVKIISGKDAGKTGVVKRAIPKENRVVVEGINIKKKHQKARKSGTKGQIIEFAAPIDVSNVMYIDPKTKKPTRLGYTIEKGKKIRVAKKSGTVV